MTTILLVEDAYDLAKIIISELEVQGYQVIHMCDGVSALQAHTMEEPALVILDWMLPKLDGLEVLRQIRQTSSAPVLMLTARDQETDRVVGLELGADDYLSKPFSMRELIARVRALLRRVQIIQQILQTDRNATGVPLTYDRLHLIPDSHLVTIDSVPLDLSPIEFALLHLFIRSPGRAFSRAYLLDTIWGETYVGGDRSVDNTILRLRKKLGTMGENIETVWGIGYKFRPERH
jgi:DNA-binding response OmpR family regulator